MFKTYKTNGSNGEFIAQEVGELALGTYTYSFFHRWTGGSIDYTEGAPKFTIKGQNADGGWDNVLVVDLVEGNTGASGEWTETTGTWVNENVNNYKIQVYKNGVANAGLAQNLHLDTFSFIYSEAASASVDCSFDVFMESGGSYPSEVSWEIQDASGTAVMSGDASSTTAQTLEMSYGDTYTLVMNDSYGDGWNGASISVNGVSYTVSSGAQATASIVCSSDPSMSVGVTTGTASATFSFTLENFTVGQGDGVDGHIHYSLNGGAEVMVYSSDDLTLSDLPNGDHTIVFSLVDANHQALDPAVEATVAFTTTGGAIACDTTYSYTYGNNESGTLFSASNPGGEVTVTVTGSTENNYDFLIITDGAGNVLYNASGDHTGQAITSTDGTIFVEIDSDSSVSGDTLDFAVTCAAALTNVTFSVNTENIEVGANGIYVGGGVLGGSDAYALSDDDGDGVWVTTIALAPGTTGNYIFFNSPNGSSDWGTKENLNGQDCADPANYDDRILDPVGEEDYTLLHCFGECSGNGTGECPAPSTTYDVTFNVNMSNYPGGLADSDIVYLNGNFVGWCGDCTPMNDDDGDGIWTVTVALEDGDYEYKFTINGWSVQEEFGSIGAVEGCTVTDGTYTNRAFTVAGADMTLDTVFWNLCPGETPGQVYNLTFAVDTANITVGDSGMYLGGGAFGDAQGHAMSDDDGDGIYEVTLEVNTDQVGANYIFLNGPGDGGDWGAKEDLTGQECADVNNYNDRMLPEFDGDTYLLHCFGDCSGDGVGCSTAPVTFPLCEDFEDGTEGWTFIDLGGLTSDWQIDTPANGDSAAALGHGYLPSDAAYDDWAISPSYDTSGLSEGTATVSYFEYLNWSADATAHNVWYATDYAGDPTTATWVLLNDVIGTDAEDVFVQRTFSIPSAESVVIGFQLNSTYGADWNIDDICIDGTLSTSDNEILDMMIYPNPVDGNYVTIVTPVQGSKEIQVFTVTGRKVMDTVINGNTLDVSSFNSGFYMLKVTVDGQSKVSKLVVR